MNIDQIANKVIEQVTWEINENKKNNTPPTIDTNELVNMYALEICHEQLDNSDLETQKLIAQFISNPSLYQQLKQLSGKLNYKQYTQINNLTDDAKNKLSIQVAKMVVSSHQF